MTRQLHQDNIEITNSKTIVSFDKKGGGNWKVWHRLSEYNIFYIKLAYDISADGFQIPHLRKAVAVSGYFVTTVP